jgi:hypothetical protein
MKDFFEEDFGITLKVSERIKMIMLASQANQHDVPS